MAGKKKKEKKKKKSISDNLTSSNLDNKLPKVSSWKQLMILHPNSTVQPETTSTLSHKRAICDEAACTCALIQSRDQISSFFFFFFLKTTHRVASFPGSPRAQTKNRKERGEPGKIYHVRNVMGRENLITCGRTNELAHAVWTEYSCDSFMADRMGLDGTMLHYLAVRKAMVSLHRPVHLKITLTYSLTWQTDPN